MSPAWQHRSPCCRTCEWSRRVTTDDYRCRTCGETFDQLVDEQEEYRTA